MSLRALWNQLRHHADEALPVWGVPFTHARAGHTALTVAYVRCGSSEEAIARVRAHIQHLGEEFVGLAYDVRCIPLAEWDHHRVHAWPGLGEDLPSAAYLTDPAHEHTVHLLPDAELHGPLDPRA